MQSNETKSRKQNIFQSYQDFNKLNEYKDQPKVDKMQNIRNYASMNRALSPLDTEWLTPFSNKDHLFEKYIDQLARKDK